MFRRKFGRSDWEVSEVSFGAWQLGGQWGPVDDNESLQALRTSYESGVNFVDTAQMYGLGHSEKIVGQSLKQWSGEQIKVATKAQPVQWPSADEGDPNFADLYPRKYLIQQVEDSLRRLDVECIDVFQLHCFAPDGMRNQEWLEVLSEMRDAGKIDMIGVSIRDYRPEDGVELAKSGLVDSIQVIYNIFEQQPEVDLFPAASQGGTAIIARVALDSGSLSGAWTKDSYSRWPEGSVLNTMFRNERFLETLNRVDEIKQITSPYYSNLAEAAVRFVLDRPEVSTAILGMSNSKRIRENVSFSDNKKMDPELRSKLAGMQWRRNYYV